MAPKKQTKEPKADKPDPYRVQCKAGLLTYNFWKGKTEEDLQKHHDELKAKFKHEYEFSSCVEEESRLHGHTFFEGEEKMDCALSFFETSVSGLPSDIENNRGKNLAQGHYYCQCIYKKSHIMCLFDVKKNPCGEWLMNLWKRNKITDTVILDALATEKLLKPMYQQQIHAVTNHKEKIRIEKMLAEKAIRMKKNLKEFVRIPQVDKWLEQYEEELYRYNFLVLHGKSKLRKSKYAESLFRNPFIHEDKMDWDGYSWVDHDAIIFDDVNLPDHIWQFVKKNKVFMQAGVCKTMAINTSATNCYKRDICVVGKSIVICTNDDLLEPFVNAEFREWVEANSVWINITEKIPFKEEVVLPIEDVRLPDCCKYNFAEHNRCEQSGGYQSS